MIIIIFKIHVLTSIAPRDPLPDTDFYDRPHRDYGLHTGTWHVRGILAEPSRNGLSILMETENHGNFETNKSYSNSKLKKKYYTPESHNRVFDGYFCTTSPRHAMYCYHVGELIIPYHYFIYMFSLIKHLTQYAPQHITRTETSLYINYNYPVSRCESAHGLPRPISKHIDWHFKCRFNCV
jgi:hypothetical protein